MTIRNPLQRRVTKILPAVHVRAMIDALRTSGLFVIATSPTTRVASHVRSGREVLRAIKKNTRQDAWIVSHHPHLFTVGGRP